ncbi:MAG: helix-turn-helix transcriptional regulator [Ruminococcaceae bacterium]|nr:helix-turn-helix transcriptional regulator [Oscillospiraceae bacterium]MBR2313136.1 helix-turn-helix transcriptional regulator [Clostridia bacterium]MBR3863154.1 helix-turn-helix transcriptional regulator [Clostridia bacterium]
MGDEKLLKQVGARINACRKELHLTQEALAERMEVSVQMISNVELGKKAIRPENLVKLCNVLNVSADYILRGNRADFEAVGFMKKYTQLSVENQKLIERLVENLMQ